MIIPPIPPFENERLEHLRSFKILDTIPELDYDSITELASTICQTKVSLITFLETDRQWLKSKVGIDIQEAPRDYSFCAHAILKPKEISVFENLNLDPRFKENPFVASGPKFNFYAGVPLVTDDNFALGTLCVLDYEHKQLSDQQLEALKKLARQVMSLLNLRKTKIALEEKQKIIENQLAYQNSIFHAIPGILMVVDLNGNYLEVISGKNEDLLFPPELFLHKNFKDILPKEIAEESLSILEKLKHGETFGLMEYDLKTIGGKKDFVARFSKFGMDKAIILISNMTDLKDAERELIRTKDVLQEVGIMSRIGGWEVNFIDNTQTWTEITKEILEFEGETIPPIEESIKLYDSNESLEKITVGYNDAIQNGKSYDLELLIKTFAGNKKWVRTIGKPIFENGQCVKIFGTFQDISDRKEYENQILSRSAEFENLFNTMAQGVVYQDGEGKIIRANPAAEKILGLSLDQMRGRTSIDPRWHAIYPDGSPFPGSDHPSMVTLRTGQMIKNQIMGVFAPEIDAYRWILIDSVPEFKIGEKKPFRVFASFHEITPIKEIENQLKENLANLNLIIESSKECIWSLDKDFNIVYANKMSQRLFNEYLGLHLEKDDNFLAPLPIERKEFWRNNFKKVFDGESINLNFNYDYENFKKYFEVSITPINVEGKIIGAAALAFDKTETTKYLMAIEEQNTRLREIAWIQSHVVRAPLARLMGLVNFLQDEQLETLEANFFLQSIYTSALELDDVIRQTVNKTDRLSKEL